MGVNRTARGSAKLIVKEATNTPVTVALLNAGGVGATGYTDASFATTRAFGLIAAETEWYLPPGTYTLRIGGSGSATALTGAVYYDRTITLEPNTELRVPVAVPTRYQWLVGWGGTIGDGGSSNSAEDQLIPNSTWTPLVWGQRVGDEFGTNRGLDGVSTTVTAGSNGQVMNNTAKTINVADASGFPTPTATQFEWATIQDSNGDLQVVRYTGKTATTLTGCTGGSMTLATGDVVAPAPVNIFGIPHQDDTYLIQQVVNIIWAGNSTGARRLRYKVYDGFFNFTIYGSDVPGLDIAGDGSVGQQHQMTGQPGVIGGSSNRHVIEVWQNSGAALKVLGVGIESPIIMQGELVRSVE